MEYKLKPVVDLFDLKKALADKYGKEFEDVDLDELFAWDTVTNNSHQEIVFREDGKVVEEDKNRYVFGNDFNAIEEMERDMKKMNKVYAFLAETFSRYDSVLVFVSW